MKTKLLRRSIVILAVAILTITANELLYNYTYGSKLVSTESNEYSNVESIGKNWKHLVEIGVLTVTNSYTTIQNDEIILLKYQASSPDFIDDFEFSRDIRFTVINGEDSKRLLNDKDKGGTFTYYRHILFLPHMFPPIHINQGCTLECYTDSCIVTAELYQTCSYQDMASIFEWIANCV